MKNMDIHKDIYAQADIYAKTESRTARPGTWIRIIIL